MTNTDTIDFKQLCTQFQKEIDSIKKLLPEIETEFTDLKSREPELSREETFSMNLLDKQLVEYRQELEAKTGFLHKYRLQMEHFTQNYATERDEMRIHFEKIMRKARSLAENKEVPTEQRNILKDQLKYFRANFTEPEKVNYFIAIRFEVQNAQKRKQ